MRSMATREKRYEGAVCIALAALVYLSRGNPDLVYPDLLYLVLLLLGVNLAAASALRRWPGVPAVSAAFTMLNAALVAGLVEKSGGERSMLWVLYLLPLYSAGITLAERHLALVFAGTLAFCLAPLALADAQAREVLLFAAAVKSVVLGLTAATVAYAMRRERQHRLGASRQRANLLTLEASLAVQEARLAAAERVAGETLDVAGIIHDARAPLTVILTSAELAAEDPSGSADAHLERIRRACRLAEHILVQALERFRQAPPGSAPSDLGAVLAGAARLCEDAARVRRVALTVEAAPGLPEVAVDTLGVERVFLNLIKNALEVSQAGGRVWAQAAVAAGPSGEPLSIRCTVEDDGPGLPPGFSLGEVGRSGKAAGTGIGLAASLRTVQRHGGTLWAEDRPGGGARFVADFPVAVPASAA